MITNKIAINVKVNSSEEEVLKSATQLLNVCATTPGVDEAYSKTFKIWITVEEVKE